MSNHPDWIWERAVLINSSQRNVRTVLHFYCFLAGKDVELEIRLKHGKMVARKKHIEWLYYCAKSVGKHESKVEDSIELHGAKVELLLDDRNRVHDVREFIDISHMLEEDA